MRQQRVAALSTESSGKIIQIEGPHKGTTKLLLLQVAHLFGQKIIEIGINTMGYAMNL